jgi:tripartite-type tricarboxylate transporter receptor subunit TctC
MFLPVHVALPLVKRASSTCWRPEERSVRAPLPAFPSLAEAAGVRDVDTDIWYGLYAPAGAPRDVVEKLNAEVNRLLKDPAMMETLTKAGTAADGRLTRRPREAHAERSRSLGDVIREAKIQPD